MRILIPVKQLDQGKSRLGSVLDNENRARLCRLLLDHTLSAVEAYDWRLITADPRLLDEFGSHAIADRTLNLNAALTSAIADIDMPYMMLPTDLPFLTADLVTRCMSCGPVSIAPDRRGDGTNILVVHDKNLVEPHFGPDSFRLHSQAARRRGIEPFILKDDRLAFDLDLPEDYHIWADSGDAGLNHSRLFPRSVARV